MLCVLHNQPYSDKRQNTNSLQLFFITTQQLGFFQYHFGLLFSSMRAAVVGKKNLIEYYMKWDEFWWLSTDGVILWYPCSHKKMSFFQYFHFMCHSSIHTCFIRSMLYNSTMISRCVPLILRTYLEVVQNCRILHV